MIPTLAAGRNRRSSAGRDQRECEQRPADERDGEPETDDPRAPDRAERTEIGRRDRVTRAPRCARATTRCQEISSVHCEPPRSRAVKLSSASARGTVLRPRQACRSHRELSARLLGGARAPSRSRARRSPGRSPESARMLEQGERAVDAGQMGRDTYSSCLAPERDRARDEPPPGDEQRDRGAGRAPTEHRRRDGVRDVRAAERRLPGLEQLDRALVEPRAQIHLGPAGTRHVRRRSRSRARALNGARREPNRPGRRSCRRRRAPWRTGNRP